MTPELQQYYEARFDMCASQGWHDLLEDVQGMIESYSDISKINGVDELYKRQGQLDILNWLVALKDISERAYEELNAETV
jgi:hypothetical protein